ncbi:hypothetical protein COLO4_05667 [Corchorus olitorius]|uniref:Reverse transcriptase RNase H-like domain-containing protein n=1 Tax=Corchorus olitorius TaxID=93759 RepID=A0A1R3KQ86_9ROSI|nr:hypothetical protein COLO4_05667 [Corchorus olitorius]
MTDAGIGALLAQDNHQGVECPVYYLSRCLHDAEKRHLTQLCRAPAPSHAA